MFWSQWRLWLDRQLTSRVAELCDDQNLLPSIANGSIHHSPEKSISSVLSHSSWPGRAHGGHVSHAKYSVAGACWLGVMGALRDEFRHGSAQLAGIWTEDPGSDDKEEPSRSVEIADETFKLFSLTSGF